MNDTNANKSAIIWCTDGGDYDYWRYSIASMRMMVKRPADFFVLALPTDNLHGMDYWFALKRIDPTPYMKQLGFTKEGYDKLGNRWPVAILYKLCVPLIGMFKQYRSVVTLDTDIFAPPTPKLHTVDDVLEHPLGEFEVAGVPDLYEPLDRVRMLINERIPDGIRDELNARVWSKYGNGCQAYISAGMFLWNIPVIDRDIDWYIRRCKAFWPCMCNDWYLFPEQDFVNAYMGVDSRFLSGFGARASGNGPYVVADATLRHFTGVGKPVMRLMASRTPEIEPAARFAQAKANLRPRETDIDPHASCVSPRKCIVWACPARDEELPKINYAIDSMKDKCGDRLDGVDLFVLADGDWVPLFLTRDDVKIINVEDMFDRSGLRAMCNWRSGSLSWERMDMSRLFIPFIPELQPYDLALYIDHDMIVTDGRMLDIFDEDVKGYDMAMSAEHKPSSGLYEEHPHVRFCKSYVQSTFGMDEADEILGRLNAGIYFSASVMLVNMREARRTFKDFRRLCRFAVSCMGNGSGVAEKDLLNCMCSIKRVSGSYNTAGSTHWLWEPTYCVHNYDNAKEGEKYPEVETWMYL